MLLAKQRLPRAEALHAEHVQTPCWVLSFSPCRLSAELYYFLITFSHQSRNQTVLHEHAVCFACSVLECQR
jgi:hypothetical protein